MKYKVLDLFSGAGGFSLGFKQEGSFDIRVSIDKDDKLSETYVKNFPEVRHISKDILSFSKEEIEDIVNEEGGFEVIIGGPPCQGFSKAGGIGRKGEEDERNSLFKGYVKFVSIVKPRIFIMENVKDLERHNKGETLKEIEKEFREIGYKIQHKVLDTKNYGIPQSRRRLIIVGVREGEGLTYEYPKESERLVGVEEAIGDLPELESGESSNVANHEAMKHSEQMLKKMSYVTEEGGRWEIPEEIRPKSGDARKYIRYKRLEPSYCITGDMRKVFHYSQNRALTNRELARLQSFPDDYKFYGSTTKIQQQIGNAVPPKLARKLAEKVREYIEKAM